jgi:CheY-like chemotaxis protein
MCRRGRNGAVIGVKQRVATMPAVELHPRVLVVEDSEDQRNLLRTYLEKAGCSVVAVPNAEDAIASYLLETPQLAIIDLLLPGINGWELVRKLRNDRPQCAIVVSSVLDVADFPDAEAILPKPFTRAQILQVLKDCVPE